MIAGQPCHWTETGPQSAVITFYDVWHLAESEEMHGCALVFSDLISTGLESSKNWLNYKNTILIIRVGFHIEMFRDLLL